MFATFHSAVRGPDGTVDPGYLGLYMVMVISLGVIPVSVLLVAARMLLEPGHPLDLGGLAGVIAASGACFGTAATGVGIFRWGDKDRPAPGTTTTTSASQQSTTQVVPTEGIK